MRLHRSRYGVGHAKPRNGRWYIWDGTRLLGFADRNIASAGPNWWVSACTTPPYEPLPEAVGARSVDEAIRMLAATVDDAN